MTPLMMALCLALGLVSCRSAQPAAPDARPLITAPADRDGDGILDAQDKCPDDPEDLDGVQDEDGCPEDDADGDGILDGDDLCPLEPETFNGFQDGDGCPDEGAALCDDCRAIQRLVSTLNFEEGTDLMLSGQDGELDDIAQRILDYPGGELEVFVVGHTSDWGKDAAFQRELALDRARQVREQLVLRGLSSERITVRAEGAAHPRVPHGTRAAQRLNDRVEILVK